jgi:hypothetical protein
MDPLVFADLVGHVLTPAGYALVSTRVRLLPSEKGAGVVAKDDSGAEFDYGRESHAYDRV